MNGAHARTEYQQLKGKIENKNARVGIVGLGYVGLPLANSFRNAGFDVIGFDIDERKIEPLQSGQKYLPHIDISALVEGLADATFAPSADVATLQTADVII